MCIQRQIDDLTQEIACWIGEMGEEVLSFLYKERIELVDFMTELQPLSWQEKE